MQNGEEHAQVGIFMIRGFTRNMGTIQGHIMDPNSGWVVHRVEGHILYISDDEGKKIKIDFSRRDSNIKYVLEGAREEPAIEGSYQGHWIDSDSDLSEDGQAQTNIVRLSLDDKF